MPFVARLPQAALANPEGPLSVIGHVDLAWPYSFMEEQKNTEGGFDMVSRSSRFDDVFRNMVAGRRLGVSCISLATAFHSANAELTTLLNQEEKDAGKGAAPVEDQAKQRRKVKRWLTRQDLAAYVTLGDPATRLNVIATEPVQIMAPPKPDPKTPDISDLREGFVIQILAEEKTAKQVADKLGIERDEVRAWVDAYQTAGRQVLKKL
jgi:hypothetical protein